MKPKTNELLTIALFCIFLFTMAALYLFLPKTEFSQLENACLQPRKHLPAGVPVGSAFVPSVASSDLSV